MPISKQVMLRTGEAATIRAPEPTDAAAVLAHAQAVMTESEFNITTPAEFTMTEMQERDWLQGFLEKPGHLALVAEVDGALVGFLHFAVSHRQRLAHHGALGISVKKSHWGRGIGKALMETLLAWATDEPGVEKVCLAVVATNERAVRLYQNLGFMEEGRRIKEVKFGPGRYEDDLLMYRWVKSPPLPSTVLQDAPNHHAPF